MRFEKLILFRMSFVSILLTSYFIPGYSILQCSAADIGYSDSAGIIRVAIVRNASGAVLHAIGRVNAVDMVNGEKFLLQPDTDYDAGPQDDGRLGIGNISLNPIVRLSPAGDGDSLKINGRIYRGSLVLRCNTSRTLTIVEELGIEEYLYGVLPLEMSPTWPLEALKAQAVAARTFALKTMGKFKEEGFDITADANSQVYGGSGFDDPRILEAVNATAGEILTWKGSPSAAYFHACCGGHTASASSAWNMSPVKPLSGVTDPYCRKSPHYSWKTYVRTADLLATLQKNGSTALKLRGVRIAKRDSSGRIKQLKFVTEQGSQT
ncbi:MAG: SpoIID/LytB domain-containing protein, partial [bacterium]